MATPVDSVTDEMVNVAHVLADTRRLRKWFMQLQNLSASQRSEAFAEMANKMKARHERPAAVAAVSLLASADVYAAVRGVVEDLLDGRRQEWPSLKSILWVTAFLALAALSIYFLKRSPLGDQSTHAAREQLVSLCPWCADGKHYFCEGPYFIPELNRLTAGLLSCSLQSRLLLLEGSSNQTLERTAGRRESLQIPSSTPRQRSTTAPSATPQLGLVR